MDTARSQKKRETNDGANSEHKKEKRNHNINLKVFFFCWGDAITKWALGKYKKKSERESLGNKYRKKLKTTFSGIEERSSEGHFGKYTKKLIGAFWEITGKSSEGPLGKYRKKLGRRKKLRIAIWEI